MTTCRETTDTEERLRLWLCLYKEQETPVSRGSPLPAAPHLWGTLTCFGIGQRHLCQALAAQLVLDGAVLTQDACETKPGYTGAGQALPPSLG